MRKLFFVLCLLLFALPLLAQEATIVGTVTDHSGAVVSNATITITNTDTGQVRTVATTESGQYVASALRIGNYNIKAEAKGFASMERTRVVLNVGDRSRVDFSMNVGAATESVTVEANAITVKTDTGEISSVINGDQLTQLSANGRSFYALVNLTPGATSLQADFQTPTPMNADKNVSFNGQRVAHNLFLIDGAEAADRGGSGAIVMPSIDAIAEFRQLTSNYSAEYGMSSSATVSTVLRSGTKSLHASAWWFGRNDFMNARGYFNPEYDLSGKFLRQPKERFNLWGFNVGGPVKFKSGGDPKTFFFYNMEWRRRITGGGCCTTNVPLPSTYGGNLTEAVTTYGSQVLNDSAVVPHVPNFSTLNATEQARFTALGLSSGQAFPNNTIPSSLLNPNAVALLNAGIFPAPNSGRTYNVPVDAPTTVKEEIVRMDHSFSDKFSVFGHFIAEQIMQTDVPTRWSGGANLPTVYDTFGNPSYSAVVHATHMISPRLLNEIAFNYGGNRINIQPQGLYTLGDTGFNPNKLFGWEEDITPIINLNSSPGKTGARYDANWTPWNNVADSYQIRDDLSWTKGSHQLKFGFSWLNFRKLQPLQTAPQGNFTFNGTYTGYDFADFLLGYASGYSEVALKDSRQWNSTAWSGYVQDNWRATSRLTLNLGLRWDGLPHTAEINGQMANFDPSLYDPAAAPGYGTCTLADGVTAIPCSQYNTSGRTTDRYFPVPGGFSNVSGSQICSGNNVPANTGCTAANGSLGTGPNPALNGLLQYTNGLAIPGVTPGVGNGLVKNYWNNWGPRIGFALDLTGNGKTVLRGGFGVMFERIQGNDMYQAGGNNLFGGNTSLSNVSLSDPHRSVSTPDVISTAVLPVTVNDLQTLDVEHYKNPANYQYSVGVQQQVGTQTVVSASYVGSQTRHLSYRQEINLPDASLLGTAALTSTTYRSLLPYKGYRAINRAYNGQNSSYNSLQVEVRSKLRDLQLQAGYTLSRAMDPTTGTGGNDFDLNQTTNPYIGWKYDWGPSIFDRTHVAFINYIYDIPFFKNSSNGFLKNALGGWQMSGIISIQSGPPINLGINASNVCSNSTLTNCAVRPNVNGEVIYTKAPTTNNNLNTIQWFDPTAFSVNVIPGTTLGTWGNLGKNALRGPGRHNWNVAMSKDVNFTERLRLQFRGECNNLWNHTQFSANVANGGSGQGIGATLGTSSFGKLGTAFDARSFQLGAKLIF